MSADAVVPAVVDPLAVEPDTPPRPPWFIAKDPNALAIWDDVMPDLWSLGILRASDRIALGMLCQALSELEIACDN